MQNIPESFAGSSALQFIQSRGWEWKVSTEPNIELDTCPYCGKTGGSHFYMEIHGAADELKNRDGLHTCHKCSKGGSLYALKDYLKVGPTQGMESRKDWSGGQKEIEPLPDLDATHQALLEDADAMDYLMNGRGFSRQVIEKMKVGLVPKRYFKETGEVRALVYPYLVNGNQVFCHYRTLPTMPLSENKVPKAFSSPKNWDVPLYNQEALRPGLKEVILVEGEPNVIAAMDKGILDICGVPGANLKKAEWIDVLDALELEKLFICYDKDRVGQKAAQTLASRIGVEKCWKIVLPDFEVTTEEGETRKGKDLNEWFVSGGGSAEAFEKLKADAQLFDVDGVASSKDSVQELLEELEEKGVEPKYKTGWEDVNKFVGFDDGDVVDILAPEKVGKLQPLRSLVKTPTGWRRIGDLQIGDPLASVDGLLSRVTGVFPQGVQEIFKVTFSDGRSTLAGAEHLWKIAGATTWERQEWRVYTTDAIANEYVYAGCRRSQKVYVPLISGELGLDDGVTIHPWLLGVLIGDGSLSTSSLRITTRDKEIVDRVFELGYNIKEHGKSGKEFGLVFNEYNGLNKHIEELGLRGTVSETKFIPMSYLEASAEGRWELLRGLMDTDGTAGNRYGTASYCTVSEQLAKDVQYLVRSLGGISRISKPQKKCFRYKGELRTGQPAYIVSVLIPKREQLFTLKRKLARVKPRKHQPRLTVESIESVGFEEAVCISVSHPSKLYVTDDFIVTHNTTFAMNLVEHMVDKYGDDGVIICLEMMRTKLARKWICHKSGIQDNIPKSPEEAQQLKKQFLTAIPLVQKMAEERDGELFFCYPRYRSTDDIYQLIIEIIRRYGVKWIVLDNLQRLADTTPDKGKGRTTHLSEISKVTSQIAKDYGVVMVRILQPHRIQEGKIVNSNNTDGSSQIAKDCDCTIVLHRDPANPVSKEMLETMVHVESEQAFSPNMFVNIPLTRYSAGGYTTLVYDGARSTVFERDAVAKAKVYAEVTKGVGYESQLKELNIAIKNVPSTQAVQEGGADEGEITV